MENSPNYAERINTPQLFLRALKGSDAVAIQALLEKNREHMIPWVPWAKDEPESVEEKRRKIRAWRGEFYLDQKYVYGIYENKDEVLVGIGFLFGRQGIGTLEIGYIIDFDVSGRGYATECTYALTKLSFDELNTLKVYIICDSGNQASARVPEKLDYMLEKADRSRESSEDESPATEMRWVLHKENFEHNKRYEPVEFILNKDY